MPKMVVMSRDGIEGMRIAADLQYAVISITGRHMEFADIKSKPGLLGLLQLKFDDVIKPDKLLQLEPMEMQHAQQIVEFAARMVAAGVEYIICHCEAGISRSSATAAALSRIYGVDNRHLFRLPYYPNQLVYEQVLQAAHDAHLNSSGGSRAISIRSDG